MPAAGNESLPAAPGRPGRIRVEPLRIVASGELDDFRLSNGPPAGGEHHSWPELGKFHSGEPEGFSTPMPLVSALRVRYKPEPRDTTLPRTAGDPFRAPRPGGFRPRWHADRQRAGYAP